MITHELKIWPQWYREVAVGNKTFEVRKNDRNFRDGDIVLLKEWDAEFGYSARDPLKFKIGFVLPIDNERVVFSLLKHE